jgi:hypothetical protein
VLLASGSSAFSQNQKIEDFQAAIDAKKGCPTIPYSELREQCEEQYKEVHDWCDGKNGPVSCKNLTDELRRSMERESRNLETLEEKRRDLNEKRDHAADNEEKNKWGEQIEAVDKEIDASKRRSEDLKRDWSDRRDLIDKTMDNIHKCINYRNAVEVIFAAALDKVRNDGDKDEALRSRSQELKGMYQQQKEGHLEQLNVRETSLETCEKERP